ncbi:hypothetical protein [Streptomyces sp. H39-S7]|uniref:hypothetical protein n=1 Tax=Streptomyces sp. H39-S7 TaxID=3004357 RepID=UPI0022AF6DAD|nr:hypothetical protein [Streptomyces sp. H39-S7]MCZ4117881.1 hypothetical protein [Streptomyces sp. H39-S7]
MVAHLPRDSATLRELHGEAADWSVTDYLLAAAVDHLAESNWMFATVNRDEDTDPLEFPKPVPRPGDTPDATRGSNPPEPAGQDSPPRPSDTELMRFFS